MRAQNISNRDYELLSAYMDGQLAPGEKQKLEERLNTRPELIAALDEMQRARTLLRQAPKRRAPRNFTVTPAMVGQTGPRRSQNTGWPFNLFPALGMASALATLLLVATLAFQVTAGGQLPQTVAMNAPAEQADNTFRSTLDSSEPTSAASAPADPAAASGPAEPAGAAEAQEKLFAAPPTATAEAAAEMPAAATEVQATTVAAQPTAGAALASPVEPLPTEPAVDIFGTGAATRQPGEPEQGPDSPAAPQPGVVEPLPEPAAGSAPAENPVIQWNDTEGRGGGSEQALDGQGGGGGGMGPSTGAIMGPPEAPDQASNAPYDGKEGAPYGNLVLPPESANSLDTGNVTPQTPAQADTSIIGSGPILGTAPDSEGGEIIDRKAIMGNADGSTAPQPLTRDSSSPEPSPAPVEPAYTRWPWLPALQGGLVVVALLTGAAALILRRRTRG